MERLVHNQVYSYLTRNDVLSPNQAGFRKGYSTGMCLIEFLHHIYSNIDAGHASGVLFLDLSKAFDTVDHNIMLDKLQHLGFKAGITCWFRSYLTNRKQVTKIGNETSSPALITHGVPQGSILGLLMFSLYVNDLPESLHDCHVSLYADDTAIDVTDKDPNELKLKLEAVMQQVSSWYQKNKLSVNLQKSKFMLMGTQPCLA